MVIWSRFGILIAFVALLGLVTGEVIYIALRNASILHDAQFRSAFSGLGCIIGGGYTWLFDKYVLVPHLEQPRTYTETVELDQPETLADGTIETHYEYEVNEPRSTLFFVPVQHWWIVLTVIGTAVIVINLLNPTLDYP